MTLIIDALLSMMGRVTMLGLSRWTEKGGSYRIVQRFFKEKIDWPMLRWQLIKQQVQKTICFLNLSLLSVETRTAYPLITEQLVRGDIQKSAPKAVMPKNPKPGRPKGSVNKNKKDVTLSPFQIQLQGCIRAALTLIRLDVDVRYFVYDGALGNNVCSGRPARPRIPAGFIRAVFKTRFRLRLRLKQMQTHSY